MSRIGPNAVLQLVPVLDEVLGPQRRDALLEAAGIPTLPDGTSMIDEVPVARLHQALRREWPEQAKVISARAGRGTGDYILAHRIPAPARRLLRVMPPWFGARLLAKAIAKHAWTFAGSGRFRIVGYDPLEFEITDNPVVRGEESTTPICVWHSQVFERLYRELVASDYRVQETACAAVEGRVCRFVLARGGPPVAGPGPAHQPGT